MGLTVDFLTAGAGLHTIAMLATAFVRRGVLVLFVSRETVDDGGAPCAARIGAGKFVRYAAAMLLLHCSVYFLFEAFGFSWMHLLAVKILLSMLATLALTWVLQLFFNK